MKIKTVKDIVEASTRILENLVTNNQLTEFSLAVDDGEGNISSCTWTPVSKIYPPLCPPLGKAKSFMSVDDYKTIMVLLLTHPQIKELEYDEKHCVTAIFLGSPEIAEINRLESEPFEP